MPEPVRFSDLVIHAALQRALAARGYETATPVQAAVLDAAAAGRDLLVSSQTGSGKTIAFGAAMAATLLAPPVEGAEKPAPRPAGAPRALVVVPTRELVAQVREELGWLMAGTGLRLASFTGGTAVGGDLRALHRGVDVAVGTPGRLVDLMRREKLVLGQVEVVVLDEADEMLDLGFREDLETLLGAAPVQRRTLLLSATLPPEIRSLARRFQRDALAIDPRKGGQDGAGGGRAAQGGHDDITYVAHLIAGGDRLAAVVNLLRASEDARAIVFCTTRDAVGSLHRELLARGFAATAISGERAQAERDRALDQVRQGEAQILVATNVAARGLHLPDVDLIIHADLPLNAESLTHRSGRTGRAGRKGTAVVIASLAERRKAERLLSMAQVRVPWTAPPSGREIAAAGRKRLLESLLAEAVVPGDEDAAAASPVDPSDDLLAPFQGRISSDDLARRLLARELDRLPVGESLLPVILPGGESDRRFGAAGSAPAPRRREPGEVSRGGVMFRVNLGAKDQADPRWLLPLICRRGGVTRREVGAIRIGPQETLFEITGEAASDFALAASQTDPRAPHVHMEPVDGSGDRGGAGAAPPLRSSPPPRALQGDGPRARSFARPARPGSDGPPRAAKGFVRPPDQEPDRVPAETVSLAPASFAPAFSPAPAPSAPAPAPAPPASPSAMLSPASVAPSPDVAPAIQPARAKPSGRPSRPAPIIEAARSKPTVADGEPAWGRTGSGKVRGAPMPEAARARTFGTAPQAPPRVNGTHPGAPARLPAHDRPYQRRSAGEPRPFGAGPAPHGRPPARPAPQGEAPHAGKPYGAKPYGAKPYGAKPYGAKPYGTKKPYAAKPHAGQPANGKPPYAKPFGPKAHGPKAHGPKAHGPRAGHTGPHAGPAGGKRKG